MNLKIKEIRELNAFELAMKLTRLQFDEEADGITASDKEEATELEKELRKRLSLALIRRLL